MSIRQHLDNIKPNLFQEIVRQRDIRTKIQHQRPTTGGGYFPFDPPPFPHPPGVFQLGLNLSGAESVSGFPNATEMGYWVSKGVTSFRIPIKWEFMQPTLFGALASGYSTSISGVLAAAASVGAKLLIDVHNFGFYSGSRVGSVAVPITAFVDLWTRLSAFLRADPNYSAVYGYDFMNEWQNMDPNNPNLSTPFSQNLILQCNHDAMAAIRGAGDNTRLYLEWDHFSGAWDSVANNIAMLMDLALADGNSKVSVHCYFDRDSSGSHFVYATEAIAEGQAPPGLSTNINIIPQRLAAVTTLAAAKQCPIHIGEIGWSNDLVTLSPSGNDDYLDWNQAADTALAYCQVNNIEVHAWAGGPGFQPAYGYNPVPTNVANPTLRDFTSAGLQATQTVIIEKYTGYTGSQPLAYRVDAPFGVVPYAPPGTPIPNYKLRYNGKITGDKLFTPVAKLNDGTPAGGTFTPSVIDLPPGNNGIASFSYTPSDTFASINITTTNNSGLIDPPAVGASSQADFFASVGSIASNIYATRRLVNNYIGPAFRLQRVSDNTQMDFFFNNRGDLPRQAIQDWANSRLISLVTWYDQSGNSFNQTYSPGSIGLNLVDTDGYPSVKWLATTRADVTSPSAGQTKLSIYADINSANAPGFIVAQDNGLETFRFTPSAFGIDDNGGPLPGSSISFTGSTLNVWEELTGTYSSTYATNNQKAYLNGSAVSQASAAQFANNTSNNFFSIGNFRFGDIHYAGSMRTIIVHYTEYLATDVAFLHSLRNTYFSTALPDSLTLVSPTIVAGALPNSVLSGIPTNIFTAVSIQDQNSGSPTDSLVITLSGATGTLTGSGITGTNPYTIASATPSSVTSTLQALTLNTTATAGSVISVAIAATSSVGTSSSTTMPVTVQAYVADVPFAAPVGTFSPVVATPQQSKGYNLQGMDNVGFSPPGIGYPRPMMLDYLATKGFSNFRLPITSQLAYTSAFGLLNAGYLANMKIAIDYAFTKNLYVIIDPHDFGGIWDSSTGTKPTITSTNPRSSALFADFWRRMATKFLNYPNVIFGLMNEPGGMTAVQWRDGGVIPAGQAIRATGATQLITIPGIASTGAQTWTLSGNAAAYAGFSSFTNFVFEMHQYLDSGSVGASPIASLNGSTQLDVSPNGLANTWLVANGFQAVIYEFGIAPDPYHSIPSTSLTYNSSGTSQVTNSLVQNDNLLSYMDAHSAQWPGWSAWSGGFNFATIFNNDAAIANPGGYGYNPEPPRVNGGFQTSYIIPIVDSPQMAILTAHL